MLIKLKAMDTGKEEKIQGTASVSYRTVKDRRKFGVDRQEVDN